jgi:transcription initiation factor IIE alpha subunit
MDEQAKMKLANEIREIIKSLNTRIKEAHQNRIVVIVSQECGPYSRLSAEPDLVSVEIREENVL